MAELLKNLFSDVFVKSLAGELTQKSKHFDTKRFISEILDQNWKSRELKDRMHHITHALNNSLTLDYQDQLAILDQVAHKFGGFTGTVFPNFVEHYGTHHEVRSMEALKFYTRFSTSEFAVRPFLKKNPSLISVLEDWSKDKNHHVRRLSSEGCRPLLPWAMKLDQYVKDPTPVLPILTRLKNDPEDYVYRSVANNLNDISKHHPDLVLQLGEQWKGKSKTTDWVIKHALRTLLKKGNPTAMKIFGFSPKKTLEVNEFKLTQNSIKIGDSAKLLIRVSNHYSTSMFRLEYVISYLKKNGSSSDKVFQITEKKIVKNSEENFSKKLDFKNLSTRKHYPGEHFIALKINGTIFNKTKFILK